MTKKLTVLTRAQINSSFWDTCVAASSQRIVYGYSWYLDAVLPGPDWKWMGVVLLDTDDTYLAVLPVPLRRKRVAGVVAAWVVHQPFFCQFLAVFSRDEALDPAPFFQVLLQRFRYGSTLSMLQCPVNLPTFSTLRPQSTHILDLSVGYDQLLQNYSRDRRLNLCRGRREFDSPAAWTILNSTDPEPLLALFRENHADTIGGGVADWAYDIFRNLLTELDKRKLAVLRYVVFNEHIEAGALFMCEGNRIIYLFNAASAIGRKSNARTLLIDQLIQEQAGQSMFFDFESPEKPAIRNFYRSFGAVEALFGEMRWNRLTAVENVMRKVATILRNK